MLMDRLEEIWLKFISESSQTDSWWERKKRLCRERKIQIVRLQGKGRIYRIKHLNDEEICEYLMHLTFLFKQHDDTMYIEENIIPFQFKRKNGVIKDHKVKI